jgi:hypothetical protein
VIKMQGPANPSKAQDVRAELNAVGFSAFHSSRMWEQLFAGFM